jgi:hypothetical protein
MSHYKARTQCDKTSLWLTNSTYHNTMPINYTTYWLTVHRSITLVDLQLDAQNSCLFTYNTFIKILYMFRALPCSSSESLLRNCIYAPLVSSLSAGDCLVHRLIKNCSSFLTRLHIYSYEVDLLTMSRVKLESCRGF